jgi:hypothetical protein
MATNRDLLKEAIADAKAVKETAIANAKAALTESFTPFLRDKLSEKIQAMDEEDDNDTYMDEMVYDKAEMENEGLDEISLDELLAELEENDSKEMEDENLYEAKEEEEMEEDEEMSIEDMNEDDLKSFIEDVIKDMVAAGELSADEAEHEAEESEEEEKAEHEEGGSEEGEEEEELDLEELLAEIELDEKHSYIKSVTDSTPKSKNAIFAKGKDEYVTDETEEDDAPYSKEKAEKLSFHENEEELEEDEVNEFGSVLGQMVSDGTAVEIISSVLGVTAAIAANIWKDEIKGKVKNTKDLLKSLLNRKETSTKEPEVKENAQIAELKSELNEINLLNAKLLYTNKIFRSKSLSESQKIKVLTAFDKARSKKEAQLVYETLLESLKVSTVGTKTSIKESLGSASKVLGSANAKPIIDVDNQFARWQTLAGINKK